MSLYRVMVSGKKDYWQWIEVEADSVEEAESRAADKFDLLEAEPSFPMELKIESVELLDDRLSKTSEEVWAQVKGE